jgi:hypothetical protein
MLMWALIWSQKFGIPVLPCGPDKAPLLKDGKRGASTDPDWVHGVWTANPDALVGGRADGLTVLDFDAYKPGHAEDLLSLGHLPATRVVGTPGHGGKRGTHLFYRGERRSGKLGPHRTIDIRGGLSHDYVILPPSSGREGTYEVLSWRPPAEVPDWLLQPEEAPPVTVEALSSRLPAGLRIVVPKGTDPSDHTFLLIKNAMRAGLDDEQIRELAESDPLTTSRRAERKRQQPNWWPMEFARCLELARSELLEGADGDKPTMAQRLMRIAMRDYELVRSEENVPFGVPLTGPRVVRALRGGSGSMRAALAAQHEQEFGHPPSNGALADVMTVLEGRAAYKPTTPLPMRTSWHDGEIVLDLGDQTGRAIVIGAGAWKVVEEPPVLFRRTDLTGELPTPVRGGRLKDTLYPLLNLPPADRALMVACILSWLVPDIDHPVVYLRGEEGTAKSSMARLIRSLVDPSPVAVRRQPGRDEDWEVTIAGQPIVVLDNLSTMPDWLSDAICTAVTKTGDVKRRKYSDQDLSVVSVRRSFILTSIDSLVSRGDLVDRTVLFEPDPISTFITQTELAKQWERDRPAALGALLDLASSVLAHLPAVAESGDFSRERMADFVHICAAMDRATGSRTVDTYRHKVAEGVRASVETDAFTVHVLDLADKGWEGTAAALYGTYHGRLDRGADSGWPKSPVQVGIRLSRLSGILRKSGVVMSKNRTEHGQVWFIRKVS